MSENVRHFKMSENVRTYIILPSGKCLHNYGNWPIEIVDLIT